MSITTFVLRIVDRRLWRSRPFRSLPLPNAPPVLHGTWAIKITTYRSKDASAYPRAPTRADGYLVIEQEFSTISVRALFDMGSSEAMHAVLRKRGGHWELWYFYDFVPRMRRTQNPQRRGAATLRVSPQGMKLEGDYWNQLWWRGGIESRSFVEQTFGDFGSADAYFRAQGSSPRGA